MALLLILTAMVGPGLWAGVVVKACDPFLSRHAGRPPRSAEDCLGLGVLWWVTTAVSWIVAGAFLGLAAEAVTRACGAAAGWAATGWTAACGLLIATRWAVLFLPPEGTSPQRCVAVGAGAAAVWTAGTVALFVGGLWAVLSVVGMGA